MHYHRVSPNEPHQSPMVPLQGFKPPVDWCPPEGWPKPEWWKVEWDNVIIEAGGGKPLPPKRNKVENDGGTKGAKVQKEARGVAPKPSGAVKKSLGPSPEEVAARKAKMQADKESAAKAAREAKEARGVAPKPSGAVKKTLGPSPEEVAARKAKVQADKESASKAARERLERDKVKLQRNQ